MASELVNLKRTGTSAFVHIMDSSRKWLGNDNRSAIGNEKPGGEGQTDLDLAACPIRLGQWPIHGHQNRPTAMPVPGLAKTSIYMLEHSLIQA